MKPTSTVTSVFRDILGELQGQSSFGSKPPTLAAQKPLFSTGWHHHPKMVKSSYIILHPHFCGLFMVFSHHFLWQNKIKQAFIDCFHHHFPWQRVETPTFFSPGEVPSHPATTLTSTSPKRPQLWLPQAKTSPFSLRCGVMFNSFFFWRSWLNMVE